MFQEKKGTFFKTQKWYLFIPKRYLFEQKRYFFQKAPYYNQFENVPKKVRFFKMRLITVPFSKFQKKYTFLFHNGTFLSKKGTFFKKRLIIRKNEGPFFGKKGIILVKKVSFDLEIGFFVAFTLVKTRPHFEKYRGIILKKKVPTQTYQSPDGILHMYTYGYNV